MMEGGSIAFWEERFRKNPGHFTLSTGVSRRAFDECEDRHRLVFPEDYGAFMRLSNGFSLLNGRVCLWPIREGRESIPDWKSMEVMNSPQMKAKLHLGEDVFLIGGNDLGDYLGITCRKEGYPYMYLSPQMGDEWYYSDLSSWFEELWEEWVIDE